MEEVEDPRREETIVESFTDPEIEDVQLEYIQLNQSAKDIRKRFLQRLTYDKVWLTPSEKPKAH